MYENIDTDMLNKIFGLSNQALIRMVNRLFQTEYADDESIWKEWNGPKDQGISLLVGGMNRYEFCLRDLDGCIQLQAEDRGFRFYETRPTSTFQIREPKLFYFGENVQEEYAVTLEFPGHERVRLPVCTVTFSERSARRLEENGLVIFLPFLLCLFRAEFGPEDHMREALKYFVIHDIVGTLNLSIQRGNLTPYDAQRLKQLCRQMIWRLLPEAAWMQELGLLELISDVLDVDLELVERMHRLELQKRWNK